MTEPEPARLHPEDVEAIARRVADLLREEPPVGGSRLVDADALARDLGVTPEWVRDNADRLCAVRLGDGPRARLRFDPERARAALTGRVNSVPSQSIADSAAGPKPLSPTVARAGTPVDRLPRRELEPRPQTSDGPGGVDAPRGQAPRDVSPTREQRSPSGPRSRAADPVSRRRRPKETT